MNLTRKVAFVSLVWTTWQHRLLAGALRFADTCPRTLVRGFAPVSDLAATARELETWGAQGVISFLEVPDLDRLLGELKPRIPMVNTALADERPGVVTLVGDFSAFVETAVAHLRHLGLRHIAIAALEEGPKVRENLVETFLRIARPRDRASASLVFSADRKSLWDPQRSVEPVPPKLARWLLEMPKPAGVLSCNLGGGPYLVRCCRALGLRVPEDVAVVGSDDDDLSLAVEPTVTSVLLSLETVGFEALRLLMNLIDGSPPPVGIQRLRCADLRVRESTGSRRPEICDINAALRCIQDHACRGLTVQEVILQTQRVSRVTFHRHFLEAVGKTPAEAIRERQIQEVRRLLIGTELPVGMISDLSGFSSPKTLARAFRRAENSSPRDYRARHLERGLPGEA